MRLTNRGYLDESFEKRCDEMPASRALSQIDKMPGSQKFLQNFHRKVLSKD